MACNPRYKYSSEWAVAVTVKEGIHYRTYTRMQRLLTSYSLYTLEPVHPLHVSPLTLLLCFQEHKKTKTNATLLPARERSPRR